MLYNYAAFYENKRVDVKAESLYSAKQLAVEKFQKLFPRRKQKTIYDAVAVVLNENAIHPASL